MSSQAADAAGGKARPGVFRDFKGTADPFFESTALFLEGAFVVFLVV